MFRKIKVALFVLSLVTLLPMKSEALGLTQSLQYNRFSCAKLNNYLKYLKTSKKGILEKHPVCNAAAIAASKKTAAAKTFWVDEIEPAYEKYFGHPSATFRDQSSQVSHAPFRQMSEIAAIIHRQNTIFILTIDGGGVRGLIPARLLQKISQETGQPITKIFQLFGGTSTGGLISLFLNVPKADGTPKYDVDQVVELYKTLSSKIFRPRNFLRGIRGTAGLLTSRYSAKPYNQLLKQYFGSNTMAQATNFVFVTSVDVNARHPFIFSTFSAIKKPLESNYYLWEAARATSAAPTYFKPLDMTLNTPMTINGKQVTKVTLIDGGVGQNNPTMEAYTLAKKYFPNHKIFLLSLGTGMAKAKTKFAGRGAFGGGALSGASRGGANLSGIIETFGDNPAKATADHVGRLIKAEGGQYFRIEPDLGDHKIGLDDGSDKNLKILDGIATQTMQTNEFQAAVTALKAALQRATLTRTYSAPADLDKMGNQNADVKTSSRPPLKRSRSMIHP